jgi:hypothetical protein
MCHLPTGFISSVTQIHTYLQHLLIQRLASFSNQGPARSIPPRYVHSRRLHLDTLSIVTASKASTAHHRLSFLPIPGSSTVLSCIPEWQNKHGLADAALREKQALSDASLLTTTYVSKTTRTRSHPLAYIIYTPPFRQACNRYLSSVPFRVQPSRRFQNSARARKILVCLKRNVTTTIPPPSASFCMFLILAHDAAAKTNRA